MYTWPFSIPFAVSVLTSFLYFLSVNSHGDQTQAVPDTVRKFETVFETESAILVWFQTKISTSIRLLVLGFFKYKMHKVGLSVLFISRCLYKKIHRGVQFSPNSKHMCSPSQISITSVKLLWQCLKMFFPLVNTIFM